MTSLFELFSLFCHDPENCQDYLGPAKKFLFYCEVWKKVSLNVVFIYIMEKKILPLDGTCCQRHLKIIKHGKLMVTIINFTYKNYNYHKKN